MQTLVTILGLACAVSAVPTQSNAWGTLHNANFDDLTALPAAALPISNYDQLFFQGFNLASQGAAGVQVAGVKPHSGSNVAAADLVSGLTQGKPALLAQGSPSKSFDLKSFYFGCVLPEANSLSSTPESCTVVVTGFRGKKRVGKQTFQFKANAVLEDMVFAKLNGQFHDLTKASFDVTGDVVPAFLVDNVKYITHKK